MKDIYLYIIRPFGLATLTKSTYVCNYLLFNLLAVFLVGEFVGHLVDLFALVLHGRGAHLVDHHVLQNDLALLVRNV
jgi:hypothetical protein